MLGSSRSTHDFWNFEPVLNSPYRNIDSYDYYFDLLDFNNDCPMRDKLKYTINNHIVNAGCNFLRYRDNVMVFDALVAKFLKLHGPTYWGPQPSKRSHLKEMDPNKGFLCPRDAQRPGSKRVTTGGEGSHHTC